ncbi:MAG TPA: hypothetical protein VFG23_13130 [Polyangia bacterium]|nr:hypothetical protein [Polyangia bacterium]
MSVLAASALALLIAGIGLAQIGNGENDGRPAVESSATRAVRAALCSFAILVVVAAALGASGRLDAGPALVVLIVTAVAVMTWDRRRRRISGTVADAPRTAREAWSVADVALATALVAALAGRLWVGLHPAVALYDTLSYHLHTPVTWMHDRRLEIVPAVFGDPAPAYAPGNLELWFWFLMAPLRADTLAVAGQLPFAALAVLAVAAAVREAGGKRSAALAAGLAFLLVPEIWRQAPTAMTDLGMAALLLSSLPFAVRLSRSAARRDLFVCAAALGLALGTKTVAIVLALPFALLAILAVGRGRARAGTPGARWPSAAAVIAGLLVVLATGGFWYARNAWLTGNPIYPLRTLGLPGLYDRATMRAWDYHLPIADLGALGTMLTAAGMGFTLAAALGLLRARPRLELAIAAAGVALFWVAVPYQESRFLFATFGLGAVALGRAAARPPAWLGWGALVLAIGGELLEFPTPDRLALIPAAVLGAGFALGGRRLAPELRRTAVAAAAMGLLVAAGAAITRGLARSRAEAPHDALGEPIDQAWAWFGAQVHDRRVAYTGSNLAFPLAGRSLSNRVAYVNVVGAPPDVLHNFGRRLSAAGSTATPEPAPYRDGADFDTWLRNLRAQGSELLFVAAMYPIVQRNVAADGEGFPIERVWADAHPRLFALRFASPAARVYEVAPP